MWKVGPIIVPVTTGALGTIKKELYQNLQLLPSHQSATELHKIPLVSLHTSFIKCWGKSH
jgi:hypothetical protein